MIDGRAVAKRIDERTRQVMAALDFAPGLGVILVGDDPASHLYVRLKERACRKLGLNFFRRELPADAGQDEVLAAVRELNENDDVHGIIVQLPLPPHLDTDAIIAALDPKKDADGFHPANAESDTPPVPPVLPAAALELLRETGVALSGLRAVVLGKGEILSGQMAKMFRTVGIETALTNPDDKSAARTADILISAVGQPGLVTGQDIKPGAIVIDIGITRVGDSTVGDVDQVSAREIASWLTPVPGGIGPVTVATLINNVARLASLN